MRPPPLPDRRFTTLEGFAVSLALLVAIFCVGGAALPSLGAGLGGPVGFEQASAQVSAQLDRSLERLTAELRQAASEGLDVGSPTPPRTSASLGIPADSLSIRRGPAAEEVEIVYQLAAEAGEDPRNGLDDDGDGLIDERRLTRSAGGGTTTVAEGVVDFRVARGLRGEVEVSLTLARAYEVHGQRAVFAQARAQRIALRPASTAE